MLVSIAVLQGACEILWQQVKKKKKKKKKRSEIMQFIFIVLQEL